MDIISYVHKSVELLFLILGLVEVSTRRSMELSPFIQVIHGYLGQTQNLETRM